VPSEGPEPILPARDLPRTRAFYESLGFTAGYHDDRYEILRRGRLVVHLEQTDELAPDRNRVSCYWRVADADGLYREFAALGLPSDGLPHLTEPQDEPWGMREFTLKDPSGNLIRIGHELARASRGS
jgi:catechol 2,3-dioxygenase-like lactoylglutathione lyase family enzyme